MEHLETIREAIVAKRKALGLRQEDVARLAQVSLPTIKALEQGRATELGFLRIVRILAALGLELKLQEANRGRPTLDDLKNEARDD